MLGSEDEEAIYKYILNFTKFDEPKKPSIKTYPKNTP